MAYQTRRRFQQTNGITYATIDDFVDDMTVELKNAQAAHSANIISVTNTFVSEKYDHDDVVMEQTMVFDKYESYKIYSIDRAKSIDAVKADFGTMTCELFFDDFKEI